MTSVDLTGALDHFLLCYAHPSPSPLLSARASRREELPQEEARKVRWGRPEDDSAMTRWLGVSLGAPRGIHPGTGDRSQVDQ